MEILESNILKLGESIVEEWWFKGLRKVPRNFGKYKEGFTLEYNKRIPLQNINRRGLKVK